MTNGPRTTRTAYALTAGALLVGCSALTGCQVDIAGQTLPSPYLYSDDVQYYAPSAEFKLEREAAALKAQSEAIKSERQAQ